MKRYKVTYRDIKEEEVKVAFIFALTHQGAFDRINEQLDKIIVLSTEHAGTTDSKTQDNRVTIT